MGISLKGEHLKRYKDIAALFMKYGRSELVKNAGLEDALVEAPVATPSEEKLAEQLAADLEKMGPTFIKVGQLLSTRADLLPLPYIEALARLQDRVGPFPFMEVEAIVSAELGVRLSKAFAEFEPEPVAAAVDEPSDAARSTVQLSEEEQAFFGATLEEGAAEAGEAAEGVETAGVSSGTDEAEPIEAERDAAVEPSSAGEPQDPPRPEGDRP